MTLVYYVLLTLFVLNSVLNSATNKSKASRFLPFNNNKSHLSSLLLLSEI